ncbi:unnamed protein product [Amoebophrya sp. A25]|nr:unnamed protein product [Amoebophrya sp. A25]|eukprot:GSA25T00024174001.1
MMTRSWKKPRMPTLLAFVARFAVVPATAEYIQSAKSPENYAICLGNFDVCHNYVEKTQLGRSLKDICTFIATKPAHGASTGKSDLSVDQRFLSSCMQNRLPGSSEIAHQQLVNQEPVSQQDFDDGTWKLFHAKTAMEERNTILIPHLNFCGYSKEQQLTFLQDKRLCSWGFEQDHVSVSMDRHVYGLSHFANGLQQILDGFQGAAAEAIQTQTSAVIDLCEQIQEISVALASDADSSIDPSEYAIDDALIGEANYRALEPLVLEEAALPIRMIYNRWAATVKEILGYRGPNALSDHGKSCALYDSQPVRKGAYETGLAMQLSMVARLLMINARTSIGIKMVLQEVTSAQEGGLEAVPHNFPPNYYFRPTAYGRHWDVLDSLLLGEHSEDPATLLVDRDTRFLLRGHPEDLIKLRSRPLKVLEIGVAVGQNGNYLLSRYPNLHYTGVDPTIAPPVRARFRKNFGSNNPKQDDTSVETTGERYTLLAMTSQDAVERFSEGEFDLVFVDGPHTYKQVNHDILAFERAVKRNGILAGHDFTCVHPPLLWGVSDKRLWSRTINYGMDGVWWWKVEPEAKEGESGEL